MEVDHDCDDRKPTDPDCGESLQKVTALFGVPRAFSLRNTGPLEAHELLFKGLPATALDHLLAQLTLIRKMDSLAKAIGMSLRTYQRLRETQAKSLSREQSGRAWKFAEILSRATDVFGSQLRAEQWLEEPVIGLDRRRPIDLLETPAGVTLVEDYLTRLEYGVYT